MILMLTRKHIQLVSVALVLVTAAAGFYAVPMATSGPQDVAEQQPCFYSAQASPVLILGGSPYRNTQGLFFHALNAVFGKRPAGTDSQVHTCHLSSFSGQYSDFAGHPTLYTLSCKLTV